jgi:hypothetical protein
MVWHIFKKDWKLLRHLAVTVALLNVIERVILSSLGMFQSNMFSPRLNLSSVVGEISLIATALLIVVVVQQDAIPGLRQDWLVRPIRRRELLLSKLLFVVTVVQGPILIAEICQGPAAGFPIGQSLGAPLARSVYMLLALDLPLLAFATLTRNPVEAVGAAIASVFGFAVFSNLAHGQPDVYARGARIGWIADSTQLAWGLVAVAAILGMQYFRRKTVHARWMGGFALLVWLLAELIPWQPAFAIQQRLSARPAAARAVQIVFDPQGGKRHPRASSLAPQLYERIERQHMVVVNLPLRIEGKGAPDKLFADRVEPRLIEPDGRIVELQQFGPNVFEGGPHPMLIPEDIYDDVKDKSVRLEIGYSLTLLKGGDEHAMPAFDGDQRIPDVGRCETRTGPGESYFELGCVTPGKQPCAVWFLENSRAERLSGENFSCYPDYSPYFGRLERDSMSRLSANLALRDRARAELKNARLVFRPYRPVAHVTRQLVIPAIRLSDWKAE